MDSKRRELERLAAAGDQDAQDALQHLESRLGILPKITRQQVIDVLTDGGDEFKRNEIDGALCFKPLGDKQNIELVAEAMYDHPIEVSFGLLKNLSNLFRTDHLDVDDWSQSGCESCDWGSNYGHSFQLRQCGVDLSLLLTETS